MTISAEDGEGLFPIDLEVKVGDVVEGSIYGGDPEFYVVGDINLDGGICSCCSINPTKIIRDGVVVWEQKLIDADEEN